MILRLNSVIKRNKFLLLFAAIIICNLFVLRLAFVFGISMEPTLNPYDCVAVWQLAYKPTLGDIVITDCNNDYSQNLIKRVIATEGQHVRMTENKVYIDGELLDEPYLLEQESLHYMPLDIVVPPAQVFLLGDNRNYSKDSRDIGCLPINKIRGKVLLRLFSK